MTAWPASENPGRCAAAGHPGVTHNKWLDATWCLCGAVIRKGRPNTVDQHLACDEMLLLPGWESSRGAQLERHIAEELGLMINEVDA